MMECGTVLTLAFLSLIIICSGVEERGTSSVEEDVELERQLKILNKPAIKTIKTEHGDIFDCVDIHKQPAFDHPLLKNHKIKMRPSFIPEAEEQKAPSVGAKAAKIGLPDGGCPQGSVPIRRTKKQELKNAKTFFNNRKEVIPTLNGDKTNYKGDTALVRWEGNRRVFGTRFILNIWGPQVDNEQYTSITTWLKRSCGIMNAGWMTDCYKETGCFNTLCPGFVQIDTQVPLGADLGPVSVYKGFQYELQFDLFKDLSMGDWWLVVGDNKSVGYWPSELFTAINEYSDRVAWGGYTYGPSDRAPPPLGSAHYPFEGYGKTCYIRHIQLMNRYKTFYPPNYHNFYADY
ncbi:hypothetical protein H6P81_017132 [Aristolochia fimbriata]|uniref:Neprosin PEP catalytic domain-containing protein n=1 Tax=Aristolochia fimbriata TaxID=158543 RepID=A0AAV7DXH4_ARIFI|nr:hypothetical protein H6P81_017132 [Aristolochia fimbriata]